ncbi:nitroreductase [Halobacillus andaensis]|uniref:Nitroreductase n=1 Tax=Halobacillus andaensis TaxID=1176239 RepID=A0A917EYU8_HALAA|nr:nitroreductase [Halobacillus andaensis]MBP2005485.1 nitroreductase [Halobacillus andaensis]GGF31867.1 nitroreductase [Halobacillus andaensis]
MELYEAITARRSIHDFQPSIIAEEELKEIFQLASWAPNHRMKQPWMVKMFQQEGAIDFAEQVINSYKRSGFTEGYSKEKAFKMMEGIKNFLVEIPHHALIYMERDQDVHRYEEDFAAVCAYIQNVQLAAWGKGIGVLWTSSPYIHDETFMDSIGLDKKKHKIIGVLQMGYPSAIPRAKTRNPVPVEIQKDHFMKRS